MKDVLTVEIRKALEALSLPVPENIVLEHPTDVSYGDYASNIALALAKAVGRNPRELAQAIVEKLQESQSKDIESISIAGAGFINFTLSDSFLRKSLSHIISKDVEWGKGDALSGEKIMVEYTDPNPFKEFHIGHLMSNAIGEAISRLIEFSGATIKRGNYQGDVGLHVAKAIWGKMKQKELPWGEAYAYGARAYEENEEAKKEIALMNKEIYEKSNPEVNTLYEQGRKESLAAFEEIYKTLGTKFDFYFFESEVFENGTNIVKENVGPVFEESQGAIIYKGEQDGLHTRVFITSGGVPTYDAKELGLSYEKEKRWGEADTFISITASEQTEYFKVALAALGRINKVLADKIEHIPHGMLRLTTGKMSSRTGDVITAATLIDGIKEMAQEKMKDAGIEKEEEIAEDIAIGAIKYAILKQAPGKDIIYDPEKSLSFEGDSGPYLQYAHTRAYSILQKSKKKGDVNRSRGEVTLLERLLYRFPEIVEYAAEERAPHHIVVYLTELASAFNSFYAKEKIIGGEHEAYNIALADAFRITMQNGLWLLAIKTPQKM